MAHSSSSPQVLVEHKQSARILVLNRPKQLNALSYDMVSQLLYLFLAYEEDPSVNLIILKGTGRAFCAGGDVTAMFQNMTEGNWGYGVDYFTKEFSLNFVMATYKKPQVSILNGMVMGGGAGASIHGRFRIATENTVFAMPETVLGHLPDVGASYFLSRLPGFYGEYVGLTGTRLDGAEMLACGLATHFVRSTKLPLLEEELCKANLNDSIKISEIIDKYSEKPLVKEKSAYNQLNIIDKCFSCRTVEEILFCLEKEAARKNDDWISSALESLKKASPTSLKIFHRSIREGRLQGVGQCLVREFRTVCHVIRGEIGRDFFEGARAILIDRDRNPKWVPSRLDQVSDSIVSRYFSKLDVNGWEDLKFPVRSKFPALVAMAKL